MIFLWFAIFMTFVIILAVAIIETVYAIKDKDLVSSALLLLADLWVAFIAGVLFIAFLESFFELIA